LTDRIHGQHDNDTNLIGAQGLVYLLFLGHNTSIRNIHRSLVGTIFSDLTQFDLTVLRLRDYGDRFLIQIPEKDISESTSEDKAPIYTANEAYLFSILPKHHTFLNETEITSVVTNLSTLSTHYPKYLLQQFSLDGPGGVLNFPFRALVAHYFLYLAQILITVKSPLIPQFDIDTDKISTIRAQWPNLPITLSTIAMKLLSDNEIK
jgi:hypothetical protein